ncbi:hypothetical protein JXA85_04255 [Candidatus Woesearchaeota archaeon]|nr:hypothetical protein [Candidatus Woesearchaeota archaeon]
MNKNGIFVSLSMILIFVMVLGIFKANSEIILKKDEVKVNYQKHLIYMDFVNTYIKNYIPQTISVTAKRELIESSASNDFDIEQLEVAIDEDLRRMSDDIQDALGIQVYVKRIDIKSLNLFQNNSWEIILSSMVDVELYCEEISWNVSIPYEITIPVNGMTYWIDDGTGTVEPHIVKTIFWKTDSSKQCVLKKLMSRYDCKGIPGIKPSAE